ncbi:carboxylating nicotinate-nucleotide diphosphorylase [Thiohalobacter sp.]|uniref:carboxylating nicotinate-nucleotide diphosphorylase n=1 Tax=Thiohalobacter sp. TaxID=2025948 RepID=UPI002635964F|nr:carboxylating nicotinate-nucleotide diphosphorylase [Thiohalobacter sp.]
MLLEALDQQIHALVRRCLDEDLGGGDLTAALVPEDALARARVIAREPAVLCGLAWFNAVFAELDPRIRIDWHQQEGDRVAADTLLCTLSGPARPLLSGERSALNLLQTLSGTATLARRYADAVAGLPVRLLDTRKTLPGLRHAQKHAVRMGGCHNHRMGLYDGILIKENHIAACGSIAAAVAAARQLGTDLPVEVEVENLAELDAALEAGADILLLDNFDLETLREAVARNRGHARLEASGGVTLETVRAIAETGVDFISVGSLTKDVKAIDLSMRFD